MPAAGYGSAGCEQPELIKTQLKVITSVISSGVTVSANKDPAAVLIIGSVAGFVASSWFALHRGERFWMPGEARDAGVHLTKLEK